MATMSARYTVIDGEVVAQERGGVRHQLVPDLLGSTVALYDNAGTKTDTFAYWPYGEFSNKFGTTVCSFLFLKKSTYQSGFYILNIGFYDPSFPGFSNTGSSPIGNTIKELLLNYLGVSINSKLFVGSGNEHIDLICDFLADKTQRKGVLGQGSSCAKKCIKKYFPGASDDFIDKKIGCMLSWCKDPKIKRSECIRQDGKEPCGQSEPGTGPKGVIEMCPKSYVSCHVCEIKEGKSCTIAHELFHICGKLQDNHKLIHDITRCMLGDCLDAYCWTQSQRDQKAGLETPWVLY